MTFIALATEDVLSEAIGLRLLSELPTQVTPSPLLRKDGSGYLRSRMDNWRQLAQRQTIIIITDLDQVSCPITLKNNWLGNRPAPLNLILRIAVREIESWILADHEAMRNLIGNKGTLPPFPDDLLDPKQHLLQIAKSASKNVRHDLVKEKNAIASQGIGYNSRLTAWVRSEWSPERAAQRSPSLRRARIRLHELSQRLKEVNH